MLNIMLSITSRLSLFIFLLFMGLPSVAQLTCIDIFSVKEIATADEDFRVIPMLSTYNHELVPGGDRVYFLRNSGARAKYEWKIENGQLLKFQDGKLVPLTTAVKKKDRFFDETLDTPLVEFVLSPEKQLFGMTRDEHTRTFENTGLMIHHSTFLGGQPVNFGGKVIVENGKIKYLENYSGHYHPHYKDFLIFLNWTSSHGVDLKYTQIQIVDSKNALTDKKAVKEFERYMPEIILLAELQKGPLSVEFLNMLKARIDREFQETGESLFLYRTNFIWSSLSAGARDSLKQIGASHGLRMPDPEASSLNFGG
jgi:hypothetical protein